MTGSNQDTLTSEVLSVHDLLSKSMAIPEYQRPYKWTTKNVNQLFDDIRRHQDKSAYRLGTIVFHKDEDKLNIVDGQQRTITLMLAICALTFDSKKTDELKNKNLKETLKELQKKMPDFKFSSDITHYNIHHNYQEIRRIISRSDFTEDHIEFLLNKCEVVTFILEDISEAFQFFDSQNARGKDLEPHDLLKAFHLREFSEADAPLKAKTVEHWENTKTDDLIALFARYLYRIRNWSNGNSARYFTKNKIGLFKGVSLDSADQYPYMKTMQITHHYVDHYSQQMERRIDKQEQAFPFQLDQRIINGRRFFELITHYQKEVKLKKLNGLDGCAKKIIEAIDSYEGRWRTGDRYVRDMFDCLLIYYIDKFSYTEISLAIQKIFIWAYSLRLKNKRVQLASMDKHVLEKNLFNVMKESIRPADFLHYSIPTVESTNSKKTKKIEELFQEMNYME